MGCGTSSKPVTSDGGASEKGTVRSMEMYDLIVNAKSPHIRLDTSEAMKKFKIKGDVYSFDIDYCYVSQRGYYPNVLGKSNQDSYLVCENILQDPNCHMFGVFDGHGEFGDHCSYYAAEQLAHCFAKELKSNGGTSALDGSKLNNILTSAFVKVNKSLHKSKVDDSLSGTTGITMTLKGDMLHVANVGDSRAIIASDINGTPKFSSLSSDQTPFRKDERERLKLKGAQIMTLDQIEGNEPLHENWGAETGEEIDEVGDPPRVWDSTLERPGCAFTRSIGDAVAEKVGVYAEPEILTWKLSPSDRLAIVASDGVFEFLTSQAVVDMVVKFKDPLEAAKHVVAEAYRLWLTYDDRTDDITCVIVVFSNFQKLDAMAEVSDRSAALIKEGVQQGDVKPIRTLMSKAKRKVISENFSADDSVEFDFEANAVPKTPEELVRLDQMVSSNFMFQHLSDHQKKQVFTVMKRRQVSAGDVVILEGDAGDELYIIDTGQFVVYKKDADGVNQLVFTYTTAGSAFGELSLMYGKPRAASVTAKTDGLLWTISRAAFRASLMKKQQAGLMKTLKTIPVLNMLKVTQLQRICERTNEQEIKDGEVIASVDGNSDIDWAIIVILSGIVKTRGKTEGKKMKTRKEGSYVAKPEMGPVVTEVIADGKVTLAFVPMAVFVDVVGEKAKELLVETSTKTNRGAPMLKQQSLFSAGMGRLSSKKTSKSIYDYKVDKAIMMVAGEFSYLGRCVDKSESPYSVKVVSKKAAVDAQRDQKVALERDCLSSIAGECSFIPDVAATCQDSKVVMLVYEDNFAGNLAMCLGAGVDDITKKYYTACIYNAVSFLHDFGMMHRFVNTESVYITIGGVPKLTDMRNVKKMEGSKVFTVCGDPLYFAPEIITQLGYDYSCDLWALGCLVHEMYEECTPFGNDQTEETALFKAITSYEENTLKFSDKTPKPAQELILRLLHPSGPQRIGYKRSENLQGLKFFEGINWSNLLKEMEQRTTATLSEPNFDLGHTIFADGEVHMEECDSTAFDEF